MLRIAAVIICLITAGCGGSNFDTDNENDAVDPFAEEEAEMREAGKPLVITRNSVYSNSVGGVTVYIAAKNLSGKTIKYLFWTVIPYNAVGDKQKGEISRVSDKVLEYTGPLKADNAGLGNWRLVWFNENIKCVVISRLKVEFMDGTKKYYNSQIEVNSLLQGDVKNTCAYQE